MPKTALLLLAVIPVLLPACAAGRAPAAGSSFGEITTTEIQATIASNAYEVIQKLRPIWLRQRGAVTFNRPTPRAVYVDNMRLGGLETLRQISPASIGRISFLDSQDATQRFGTGHVNGAILIFSR